MIVWFQRQRQQIGVVSKEDARGPFAKRMPEASDKGSQPYRKAFRFFEMAGMRVARLISACPWVGDMSGCCPLPKGKVPGVGCRSFQPFRSPQGDSCMAGYHCLMPTAFLPSQHNTNLTPTALHSIATQHKIKHPPTFPSLAESSHGIKTPKALPWAI